MTSYLHSDWSVISYEHLWLAEVSLCIFVIVNGVTISRLFPDNKLGFYPPWHSATLSYGGVKMGNQLEQTQQPHIHEIQNILNVKMKIFCFSHCWAGLIKEKTFIWQWVWQWDNNSIVMWSLRIGKTMARKTFLSDFQINLENWFFN